MVHLSIIEMGLIVCISMSIQIILLSVKLLQVIVI